MHTAHVQALLRPCPARVLTRAGFVGHRRVRVPEASRYLTPRPRFRSSGISHVYISIRLAEARQMLEGLVWTAHAGGAVRLK